MRSIQQYIASILNVNTAAIQELLQVQSKKSENGKEKAKSIQEQYNRKNLSNVPFVPPVEDSSLTRLASKPVIDSVRVEDGSITFDIHVTLPVSLSELKKLVRKSRFVLNDSNELTHKDSSEVHFIVKPYSDVHFEMGGEDSGKIITLHSSITFSNTQLRNAGLTRNKAVRALARSIKAVLKGSVGSKAKIKFINFPSQASPEESEQISLFMKSVDVTTLNLDYIRSIGTPGYQYLLVKAIVQKLRSSDVEVSEVWTRVLERPNTFLNPTIYVKERDLLDAESDV